MKRALILLSVALVFGCNKTIVFTDSIVTAKSVCDTTPIVIVVGPAQSLEVDKQYATDITIPSGYAMAFKGLATRTGSFVQWDNLPNENENASGSGLTSELHFNEATLLPSFIKTFHQLTNRRLFIVKYAYAGTLQGWNLLNAANQKGLNWGAQGSGTIQANGRDFPLFKWWTQTIDSFLKRSNLTRGDVSQVIYNLGYSDAVKLNTFPNLKNFSYDDLYDLLVRVHQFLPNAKINIIQVAQASTPNSNGFKLARQNQDSVIKVLPYCTIIDTSLKHYPVSWTVDGLHPNNIGFDTLGARVARNMVAKYNY